jgi:thioredoxin-related protein
MNKIIILVAFSILTLNATTWHTLEDAKKLQKQNSKIIMLDIGATHCRYCKKMDKNVFDNPKMSKWLNDRFIAVKYDLDNEILPYNINCKMTPTFYFISKDDKIIKTIPGSWSLEDFKDLIKEIK